jgi:predicted phosphodiesterase
MPKSSNESFMTHQKDIRRLGVIGDLHGEHGRLAAVLDWFAGQRLDAIVCTGDIADGRGCINRSCELLREGEVITVAGNHDRWLLNDKVRHLTDAHQRDELNDENAEFMKSLPRRRLLETVRGRLLLCHGVADNDLARVWPGRKPEEIKRCAELDAVLVEGHYSFLINGHMHFRVLIDFAGLTLLNGGTLKGDRAGVCVVDFETDSISAHDASPGGRLSRLVEKTLTPGPERRIWQNTEAFDGSWVPETLYA